MEGSFANVRPARSRSHLTDLSPTRQRFGPGRQDRRVDGLRGDGRPARRLPGVVDRARRRPDLADLQRLVGRRLRGVGSAAVPAARPHCPSGPAGRRRAGARVADVVGRRLRPDLPVPGRGDPADAVARRRLLPRRSSRSTYAAVVLFMRGEIRTARDARAGWTVRSPAAAPPRPARRSPSTASGTLAGGSAATVVTNLAYPVGRPAAARTGRRRVDPDRRVGARPLDPAGRRHRDQRHRRHRQPLRRLTRVSVGFVLDGIAWPASILLLSMSVWFRPRPTDPLLAQKPSTFVIPGLSATLRRCSSCSSATCTR